MFCHKCGHKLIDGSEYCSYCGTKIDTTGNDIECSDENFTATNGGTTIPVQEVICEPRTLRDGYALKSEDNASTNKKFDLKAKIADKAVAIVSFMVMIFLVAFFRVFGKMLYSNPYIAYLYPSIMVGALAAGIIYLILGCLNYFKTKFWTRFYLVGIALASGVISGAVGAGVATVILLRICIVINNNHK